MAPSNWTTDRMRRAEASTRAAGRRSEDQADDFPGTGEAGGSPRSPERGTPPDHGGAGRLLPRCARAAPALAPDGGEGNRTPNSGMQGRRVPVSTTPPGGVIKGRGAATPAPWASCRRRRGKGGVAAVRGSTVVRPPLGDRPGRASPELFRN